ncbi:MAG TPA: helix-turn-helix domain-containing protein [Acidimicrobiales bacterium]|nr:helix-turn-helix domain-containing protein [Acidimicrobiales bacterium]
MPGATSSPPTAPRGFDARVFGQRVRHYRRLAGLTLDKLGADLGRPASWLSQVENGHREPKLSTVDALAAALGCSTADLLDPAPPNRRAELEVELARLQAAPAYADLGLPALRPSARVDDLVLEHLVALASSLAAASAAAQWSAVPAAAAAPLAPVGLGARAANAAMRAEMRRRDNYFEEIEREAGAALAAVDYAGPGTVSERHLTDVAAHYGFRIARVMDLPPSARSITDVKHRVIYVPQRNNASNRTARSVIAQTLGHFALGHEEPADFEGYVRQRVEANYFAGALLAPESAAVAVLGSLKAQHDISVEDLSESFYISYEMAAHRLTNLITRHFDIPVHFQRSDPEGVLWKAYENDGVLLPADVDGTIEGQRVCRYWSARQAFESSDAYSLHHQWTETANGWFWCATHVEVDRDRGDAVTVGTSEPYARFFRGSDTTNRAVSRCPDPACCRAPAPALESKWAGAAWTSARDHSHFVSGLPTDTVSFSPYPGVELTDVYAFLDRHAPGGPPAPRVP